MVMLDDWVHVLDHGQPISDTISKYCSAAAHQAAQLKGAADVPQVAHHQAVALHAMAAMSSFRNSDAYMVALQCNTCIIWVTENSLK